jgi:hypothetical protein
MITDINYEELNNEEYIYNEINSMDNIEINNGQYCIGMCFIFENKLIYENKIPNKVFYKYRKDELLNYLIKYSSVIPNWQRIEIIKIDYKIDINGFTIYYCILKTYYIRLVQRTWKRVFRERQRLLNNSSWIINNLQKREIGIIKNIRLPGIVGLFI